MFTKYQVFLLGVKVLKYCQQNVWDQWMSMSYNIIFFILCEGRRVDLPGVKMNVETNVLIKQ